MTKNIKKESINNEYIIKKNHNFIKTPNFKYKLTITDISGILGANDIFEVFLSYRDNKEYAAIPNYYNFNIEIFSLLDYKNILSLKRHLNSIRTIRYFINNKNKNEYLISADNDKIVIIWDVSNNYSIKSIIDTNYEDDIGSCLLVFPHIINDDYIITSTNCISNDYNISATKIYSLTNGKYIKYINNSNNYYTCYLIDWYNKKNNNYYLIELVYRNIVINNLLINELYCELIK